MKILIAFLMLMPFAHAEFGTIGSKRLNVDFSNGFGTVWGDLFLTKQQFVDVSYQNFKWDVLDIDPFILLKTDNIKINLKWGGLAKIKLNSLMAKDLDLKLTNDSGAARLVEGKITNDKFGLALAKTTANCEKPGALNGEHFGFKLLQSCLTNSKLRNKAFTLKLKSVNKFLKDTFLEHQAELEIPPATDTLGYPIPEKFHNVHLNIKNHKISILGYTKFLIDIPIKAYGESEYNLETNILKFRIDKVKVSFINITDHVFKELNKIKADNVEVKRPYVTIKLP